jgi:hypothetical protein
VAIDCVLYNSDNTNRFAAASQRFFAQVKFWMKTALLLQLPRHTVSSFCMMLRCLPQRYQIDCSQAALRCTLAASSPSWSLRGVVLLMAAMPSVPRTATACLFSLTELK